MKVEETVANSLIVIKYNKNNANIFVQRVEFNKKVEHNNIGLGNYIYVM